ncbi:AMP-binding protein [Sphingomonas sp. MMS24-JH45]
MATPATLAERPHDPRAPFAIQYTSGTTSRPKAVLWTHANALWGAEIGARNQDLRGDDVYLVHLPLFHTNAQSYSVLSTFWAGGSVVVMPRFSTSRFWPTSLAMATWTSMVPFCVKALLGEPVPAHRYRFWGNGVCEPDWDRHFGVKTIGWWGMTETITQGTVGSAHLKDAAMSIGRPAPGYEIHACWATTARRWRRARSRPPCARAAGRVRCSRNISATRKRPPRPSPPTACSRPATGCGTARSISPIAPRTC